MLMRTDPFRELDRFSQQLLGNLGTTARPAAMPMDAWRVGDEFVVAFDLPGVDPGSVDLDVERNVLTVRAERVQASYQGGVLTLRIPVAEKAKPRKITISHGQEDRQMIDA